MIGELRRITIRRWAAAFWFSTGSLSVRLSRRGPCSSGNPGSGLLDGTSSKPLAMAAWRDGSPSAHREGLGNRFKDTGGSRTLLPLGRQGLPNQSPIP